jgi:hypothetical protein
MLKKNEPVRRQKKVPLRKRQGARPIGFSPPSMISSPELLMGGSDDEFRQVVYLFVKVLGRLMTCREAFGAAINLTGSQFAVLVGVAYRQGESGITVKELSRYVHLAPTHVTTEVGRLHRQGLLEKKAGPRIAAVFWLVSRHREKQQWLRWRLSSAGSTTSCLAE